MALKLAVCMTFRHDAKRVLNSNIRTFSMHYAKWVNKIKWIFSFKVCVHPVIIKFRLNISV